MRVVVLGGAGDMGSHAVRLLATRPEVGRVSVADVDAGRAAVVVAAANAAAGRKVAEGWPLDAADKTALAACLAAHDVAAGALGPFYRWEGPLVEAAIAARVPYVSLCDDYDGAAQALALDERARAAGVPVVTGLGWTPGLTNLVARAAWDHLDRTRAIHIAWAGAAADSAGLAVILHTMHAFTGRVPAFLGGRPARVPAGSGRRRVDFGPPIGRLPVYHAGHPEPVTLPRFLPGLDEVTLRGGLSEQFLQWLAVAVGRLGLTATAGRKAALGRVLAPLLPLLERIGPRAAVASGMRVDVVGERGGQDVGRSFVATGRMADLTARPLALGALWLGAGKVSRVGVFAPEADGGIAPEPFLAELRAQGVSVREVDPVEGEPA